MQTRMLIDLNETVKKGDPAPRGSEKRYIRAGIAEVVKPAAPKKAATKRKAKAKAAPKPAPTPAPAPVTPEA